jgi:hypothetical protein
MTMQNWKERGKKALRYNLKYYSDNFQEMLRKVKEKLRIIGVTSEV